MSIGQVSILNVSDGDTKLTFDNKDPVEVSRASRIVKNMLRQGYVLFVDPKGGDNYERALDFDERTNEYIIADFDPEGGDDGQEEPKGQAEKAAKPARKKAGKKTKRVPAQKAKGVAVGRTAGG